MDRMLRLVASLKGMVLRRETQLFIVGVSMPPLQAGPSRPSRGAEREDSTRSRGRRRAPIRDDPESSKEEESVHPQLKTSAGREDDSGSSFEGGGDVEKDSEGGDSDSDGDDMDRSWMLISNRFSQPFVDGVNSFIEFAKVHLGEAREIKCPCINCCNFYKQEYDIVKAHLLISGMIVSYTTWLEHGELPEHNNLDKSNGENDEDKDEYDELIEDYQRGNFMEGDTLEIEDVRHFDKLLDASQCFLYPGCKNSDTLLSFVIQMLHVKVENRWSNKSFDKVLEIQRRFLPEGHVVPGSIYECKKLLRDLGLGYELIDACKHDCVLFWKENAHLEKCPTCQASRYRVNDSKGKKIPHKILRYFPLTPRLRRLYMSRKMAKDMRWHNDKHVDDGVGRHPTDCKEWKEFDLHYPEFAQETRNVRLGLATDGFNPFGNMSTSYNMWPVILMPYNLPPWRCMKAPFFMMSLLIPGRNQPGIDIDFYLRPSIDELKELWENGVMTYDASTEQTFRMYAAVMWTINDFTAYVRLGGWVGHRAYLPDNHLWRKDKKFDGLTKLRKKSLDLPVEKVMAQLDQLREVKFGKDPTNKKRPRESEELNWTKKSIMWELPYWKKLNLRHNLDVMHIEKNSCENFYGTMLAIDGKNKDMYKTRDDLQEMGIRKEFHLQRKDNGSVVKPRAAYTLDSRQIDGFVNS
ncbi:uncharacterized protein LOC114256424 [Camellia sinensis]|uniref:uncharacterized protein LOC114256424 n=1 Tax=Camellia sinensis TaxID=4442 RepID=UPI0010357862|nr:uncharacterized protein LOC114256424 [Camellia sinensis]